MGMLGKTVGLNMKEHVLEEMIATIFELMVIHIYNF